MLRFFMLMSITVVLFYAFNDSWVYGTGTATSNSPSGTFIRLQEILIA